MSIEIAIMQQVKRELERASRIRIVIMEEIFRNRQLFTRSNTRITRKRKK